MKRWHLGFLVVGMALGCSSGSNNGDGGMHDLSGVQPDLSMSGGTGVIGGPCASTADCREGTTPVCWRTTLFNRAGFLTTHGGYCSSACTADTDCGAAGHCIDFGTGTGKFCLAGCMSPTEACPSRTGYACFTDGNCFPADNLTCDPLAGDGSCTTFAGGAGGCQRAAFGTGNKGSCQDTCAVGVGTCGPDNAGSPRHCIVDDERGNTDQNMVKYGDKWVGPMCFTTADPVMFPPIATGSECKVTIGGMTAHFEDICVDGDECYLKGTAVAGMGFDPAGDQLCHPLCYLTAPTPPDGGFMFPDGGALAVACPGGQTCHDIWGLAAAPNGRQVGLCK